MKEEPSRALLATRAANTFLSLMWNDELVPLAICLTFHFARKREQWRPARVRCVDKGHRFPAAARYLAPRERERERGMSEEEPIFRASGKRLVVIGEPAA